MGSTVMMYILPMMLGQTYDLGKDKTGIPIFLDSDVAKATELEQYFTDSQYRLVQNSDDVKDFLDISGKLALKIKGGMIDVSGEGSYLRDSSSKKNGLEILIKLHFETVTKTIPSSVKPRKDWLQYNRDYLGTHYCRSITYGGDLIASVRISAPNSYDMNRIKGSLNAGLNFRGGFSAQVKGRLESLKKDAQDISSMEINYYATVPLKGVSYTVDGLMKLIEDFPDHVKSVNSGLGNPLRMELYPLSSLEGGYPIYLENRALTELLSDIEDQFDDLRATRKVIGTWITELPPDMNPEAENKIREFSDTVNSIYGTYLKTIGELDVSREASTAPLYDAIEAYKHNEYIMPEKYIHQFNKLKNDIYTEFPELKPRIGGALYSHWGRYDCPSEGSEVVVAGVAAASENFQNGGSSDYVCSPVNPDLQNATTYFPNYDPDEDEDEARDILVSPLRYMGKLEQFQEMFSKHIACARCRTTHRTSVFVKPAGKTCPKGYTAEYVGVLMAPGYNSVPKGSYICVDLHMQQPVGDITFGDEFVNHLASVQEVFLECGSLPCASFVEKKPIPCVVCTV